MIYSFFVNVLIVGGNGKIGERLYKEFSKNDFKLMRTSHYTKFTDSIYLDLNQPSFENIPKGPGTAIICIGISNIQKINDHLAYSYFINVTQTIKLINTLIRKGWRVVYLSSDVVFQMGVLGLNSVSTFYKNYTLQKYMVESTLSLDFGDQIKIVRLSKVVFENLGLIREIEFSHRNLLRKNHFVSPTSIDHVLLSLKRILESNSNLSLVCGAKYTSYFDFVRNLDNDCNIALPKYTGYYANNDEVFQFVNIDALDGVDIYAEPRSELLSFITCNSDLRID